MKSGIKTLLLWIALIAVVIGVISYMKMAVPTDDVVYSDVRAHFINGEVKSFVVDGENNIEMVLRVYDENGDIVKKSDGTEAEKVVEYELRSLQIFLDDCGELIARQYDEGIIEKYDYPPIYEMPWWISLLPYVIIIVLFVAIWFFMMNQASGGRGKGIGSFGKNRAKLHTPDKNQKLFSDVAGADQEKAELEEIVEFLKNPAHFTKLGAKIPHGVLLMGPPGTGKTLLAKAVAGEAGVPFYSISGSDFVEMYVGVGASRVRDLFDTARKNPASIVFIDEIDAVGRHRGAGLGGGHDEREQTLNQLLVEMDGFGANEGVIVIAATNRPDILDPALLRPGRFDRQITVGYPDLKGRCEILKVHSKNKPFESDVDLERIAHTTVGFTGADLANLLNEASLIAARKGKSLIGNIDIEEATIKIIVGMPKKNVVIKPEEKRKTAYHEAGHAIIAHVLPHVDPVRQISIIPSGRALGYTLTPPVEDKYSQYKNGMIEEICMILGGRAAEAIIFDDISGGASNDIQKVTQMARTMVTKLGMSDELGPVLYGSEAGNDEVFLGRSMAHDRTYSEDTAARIDNEIHRIISEAYERAKEILRENIDKLHFIAEFLIKNEIMDDKQFKLAMDGDPTIEELEEMVADKRRKSEEENKARLERIKEQEKAREEERARNKTTEVEDSDKESL